MYEFWEYVKSQPTHVLILALILGLVGSWLGAYPVRGLDWLLGRLSRRWSERSQVRAAARKWEIDRLRANSREQVMTAITALDDKLQGIMYIGFGFLFGFVSLLGSSKLTAWIGIAAMLVDYMNLLTSWKKLRLVSSARR